MNNLIVSLVLIMTSFLFSNASVATEASSESKIDRLVSYSGYSTGIILVSLGEGNGPSCETGYFIDNNTKNRDSIFSMILSAYHAKTEIVITGDPATKELARCHISEMEYK